MNYLFLQLVISLLAIIQNPNITLEEKADIYNKIYPIVHSSLQRQINATTSVDILLAEERANHARESWQREYEKVKNNDSLSNDERFERMRMIKANGEKAVFEILKNVPTPSYVNGKLVNPSY